MNKYEKDGKTGRKRTSEHITKNGLELILTDKVSCRNLSSDTDKYNMIELCKYFTLKLVYKYELTLNELHANHFVMI